MTIDLLPTLAKLAGAAVPTDTHHRRPRHLAAACPDQRGAKSPHDAFYFYWGTELHAVRSGKWKLHLPHPYQSLEQRRPRRHAGQVRAQGDAAVACSTSTRIRARSTNVAEQHPDVVKKLMDYAERAARISATR